MPSMTLGRLIGNLGKDHFYLMHLSYGYDDKTDRQPLWNFAKNHKLIGLSKRGIDRPWPEISSHVRNSLTSTWQYHFRNFSSMEPDDLVVIVDGITDLLGIARVNGPYEYRSRLANDFFDHVRRVEWLLAYDYEKRKPEHFGGFGSTLVRVVRGSPYWDKTRIRLDLKKPISGQSRKKVRKERIELERKYGISGESYAHKQLKRWVYDHPETVGIDDVVSEAMEYRFPTGDRADVVFNLQRGKFAVVEIETVDTFTGARQALKYKVLKCMETGLDIWSNKVEPILVAWQNPGADSFCKRYGVRFIKKRI